MRFQILLLILLNNLAAIGIATLTDNTPDSSHLRKRHVMSCEETYGAQSKQCGPPRSGYCFDPSQGQDETIDECAIASGFDLPVTTAVAQQTRTPASPWPGGPTSWLSNASLPHFPECTGASSGMANPTGGGPGSGCLVLNGTGWFPFVESSGAWRWDRRLPAVSTALAVTAAIFSLL